METVAKNPRRKTQKMPKRNLGRNPMDAVLRANFSKTPEETMGESC